ncbi:hypothetical protein [Candidatus Chloroploca asiatica]|uniref:Uncharacterized protein n=1 Tax=Candidatus Chloroploca asiatica TaxID=1506545 RepID=A0A2H3KLQ2_9CHLR|nr:hypothetical protein [Candidatus Chloroploca asiatica]PDV98961.1 hypothetical protein A9Q02_14000 [Candidatus Chloroploca asiatica]
MSGEQNIAIGAAIARGAAGAVMRQQRDGSVQEMSGSGGVTSSTQILADTVYMGSGNALYASLSVQDGHGQVVYSLSPGQSYQIQVTTQTVGHAGQALVANHSLTYRLAFLRAADDEPVTLLCAPTRTLTSADLSEARQLRHDWLVSFDVPAQVPAQALRLVLYACAGLKVEDGKIKELGEQDVTTLKLQLKGQGVASADGFSSEEIKLLGAEELKLLDPAVAPSNVAYIYVQRPAQQLEILPFCKGNVPTQKIALSLDIAATYPYLTLDQAQGASKPGFLTLIRAISSGQLEDFWVWQQRFQQRDNPIYALFDLAKSGLPWELLEYQERSLGCQGLLVRWERFVDFTTRQLVVQDEERNGRVLALSLDNQPLPDALQRLNPDHAADMVNLWERLFAKPDAFALIYLSGVNVNHCTALINGLKNNFLGDRLTSRRPIIMLVGTGTTWTTTMQHSFDQLTNTLMRNVADGLITLAAPHLPDPIRTQVAGELVALIVQDVSPSEALRQLRNKYVQARAVLRQEAKVAFTAAHEDEQEQVRQTYRQRQQDLEVGFLASSVYVYYGNPLLRLRLEQTP